MKGGLGGYAPGGPRADEGLPLHSPPHVEVQTHGQPYPNVPYSKLSPASPVTARHRDSLLSRNLDCHVGGKAHVVDFFDKVVPGIVDGCRNYMLGREHSHMLGPRLSHPKWNLYVGFARAIPTRDVQVVLVRAGIPSPMCPSLLPLCPAVATTSQSVDDSDLCVAHVLSPLNLEAVTYPPADASPKDAAHINHQEYTSTCKRPGTLLTVTTGSSQSTTTHTPTAGLRMRTDDILQILP